MNKRRRARMSGNQNQTNKFILISARAINYAGKIVHMHF